MFTTSNGSIFSLPLSVFMKNVFSPKIDTPYCRIHGGGAKLKFRPSWKTVVGPDGKQERVYEKKGYYVCDLGQEGGG